VIVQDFPFVEIKQVIAGGVSVIMRWAKVPPGQSGRNGHARGVLSGGLLEFGLPIRAGVCHGSLLRGIRDKSHTDKVLQVVPDVGSAGKANRRSPNNR
jgi:hypothetical protein